MARALEPGSRKSHTLGGAALFHLKATLLRARRSFCDPCPDAQRHAAGKNEEFPYLWAQSVTPLWSDEPVAERSLQQGKVQNLRCATRQLNHTCVPQGGLFSFWKQIGPATTRRGYAPGRLLREGCLIPAVGGGLCQLSNALYDVALKSGCEMVERHAHSHIVPSSSAATGRDATVAWNYIDLRFRAPRHVTGAMLVTARLTARDLIVELRGQEAHSASVLPHTSTRDNENRSTGFHISIDVRAHSCSTCAQSTCFRHQRLHGHGGALPIPLAANVCADKTAFLLDVKWPEWQEYVAANARDSDVLCVPLRVTNHPLQPYLPQPYNWSGKGFEAARSAPVTTLQRAVRSRRLSTYGARRIQHELDRSAALTDRFTGFLPIDATHACVAQSLLPHLWRDGALGGRTFDVLMTRLPLRVHHARLDEAWMRKPDRKSLCEFRAPRWLVELESEALDAAQRIITPHAEIAALFNGKSMHLPWHAPRPKNVDAVATTHRRIAFPGPTAARKGAYEVRDVARELDCEVVLLGSALEGDDFWSGLRVQHRRADGTGTWCRDVAAVVQPALVEERPHQLLQAMALGVPVVASAACGLLPHDCGDTGRVLVVPTGNTESLRAALASVIED